VVIEVPGGGAELDGGVLVRSWGPSGQVAEHALARAAAPATPVAGQTLPTDTADEIAVVGAWLDANAHRVKLVSADAPLASPLPVLASFAPIRSGR
jgi:hypothetical protein